MDHLNWTADMDGRHFGIRPLGDKNKTKKINGESWPRKKLVAADKFLQMK